MRRARVRCALGVIAALGLALGASTAHTQSEAPLTDSELRNATYPSEFTADGVATLRDGEFRGPAAPDRLGGGFAATAVDSTVISDGAAVVVLRVTGSGSATWYVLYAATRVGGVATPGPPVLLGDNAQVVSLGLGQGRVRVEFRTFAPGDSHCCPSRIAVREYARSGNVLTPRGGQRAGNTDAAGRRCRTRATRFLGRSGSRCSSSDDSGCDVGGEHRAAAHWHGWTWRRVNADGDCVRSICCRSRDAWCAARAPSARVV